MKHVWKRKTSPIRVIVFGYLCIILLGTALLCTPFASRAHVWTPIVDSLFTATSATCVTGLVIYDTFTYWSLFGQLIILIMIQIGGIGFMTLAISALTFTKRKIGLRDRYTLQESFNAPQVGGIVRMTRFILLGTAIFEITGAVALSFRFCPQFGFLKGVYFSVFHSVSAFCNAGFDLMGESGDFSSLTAYAGDWLVNTVICILIIIGGLGFFVWSDISENKWHFRRYKLHTKVVLVTTVGLILIPFLLFLLFERNTEALTANGKGTYALSLLFQTITPRTAGFNTIQMDMLSDASVILVIFLMLIGGSPSSTAGGLKTTTFAMLIAGIFTVFRQRKHVECFHRRLSSESLIQILCVSTLFIMLFFTSGTLICSLDNLSIKDALFEVASALGTVGLSLGITAQLSTASHIVLACLMFFGRVGGLTLLIAFHGRQSITPSKYPVERITIG